MSYKDELFLFVLCSNNYAFHKKWCQNLCCLYESDNAKKERCLNKMNCELMLTYDTPALRQTGSRKLTVQKTLPKIWGTYMKLVTKYQISAINSCWEKCDEKCIYTCMFNVYRNQLSRQTGSGNLTGPKNASHNMAYLYEACDQISDSCHQ
jgi:hypothetical protein